MPLQDVRPQEVRPQDVGLPDVRPRDLRPRAVRLRDGARGTRAARGRAAPRVLLMMDDPKITRPKEPWAVSFGVMGIVAGCVVTALVFMVLVFTVLTAAPDGELEAAGIDATPARLALLIGGFAAIAILVVGPTLALGVGWLLRKVRSQSLHVLAFAALGVVVGALGGFVVGGPQFANILAAMLGASAAAGRAALSPFARV